MSFQQHRRRPLHTWRASESVSIVFRQLTRNTPGFAQAAFTRPAQGGNFQMNESEAREAKLQSTNPGAPRLEDTGWLLP
jgi:hypothetical protein